MKSTRLRSLSISPVPGPTSMFSFSWNDNALRPALLHLLHLPTLIKFKLFTIKDFLVTDLTASNNIRQLDISYLRTFSNVSTSRDLSLIPIGGIHEFSVGDDCSQVIVSMCAEKCADGRPLFDFSNVDKITLSLSAYNNSTAFPTLLRHCERLTRININISSTSVEPSSVPRTSYHLTFAAWNHCGIRLTGLANSLQGTMQALKDVNVALQLGHAYPSDLFYDLIAELEQMRSKNDIRSIVLGLNIAGEISYQMQ